MGLRSLKSYAKSARGSAPYIIVISAGASERGNKVLELGANEYMPKPFHLTRLLERIQTVERYLLFKILRFEFPGSQFIPFAT